MPGILHPHIQEATMLTVIIIIIATPFAYLAIIMLYSLTVVLLGKE